MNKTLVRVPHWLGDAVVSTVFIKRLKARSPQAEIHVLAPPYLKGIFESHPDVSGVHLLPKQYKFQVRQVGVQLREHKFDVMYVLPKSARTAFEAWFSCIPTRIGFGGDLRALAFTNRIAYNKSLKYPLRYLKLIGEEDFDLATIRPHFPAQEPSLSQFTQAKRPWLLMAPLSIAPARTWDSDRFVEIANRFHKEKGGTLFLMGSKKEEPELSAIKKQCQGNVVLDTGTLKFPEVGWMMSKADALIANDSGLMHIASAFDLPTLVLFGASDPNVALPVSHEMVAIQNQDLTCVPCYKNHCQLTGKDHRACLTSLSVDQAWQRLLQLRWRN